MFVRVWCFEAAAYHVIHLAEVLPVDAVERASGKLFLTDVAREARHVVGLSKCGDAGRVADGSVAFRAEL